LAKIIGAVMAKADGLDGSVVSTLVRENISLQLFSIRNISI